MRLVVVLHNPISSVVHMVRLHFVWLHDYLQTELAKKAVAEL